MRDIFAVPIAAIFALCAATVGSAQVVRGDVVDGATNAPVAGAMVVVFDSAGARVAGAITNDSGRFALRLPKAGRFALRAERIGYISGAPVPFAVEPGATVMEHVVAASAVAVLPTDTITGDKRCVVRATEGAKTAVLWEEARKALYASQLADSQKLVFAVVRKYWGRVDATGSILHVDSMKFDSSTVEHPFETPLTPEELTKFGYGLGGKRRDSAYAAPDADVLLSDAFASAHCFQVRLDGDGHKGMVGLAFSPARKVNFAEVTGVLWLDSASARLRYLEFRHTNLFPEVSPLKYGGRLDFEELAGGVWIVRQWYIRLPVVRNGPSDAAGRIFMEGTGGPHVDHFTQDGGEVLNVRIVAPPPASP